MHSRAHNTKFKSFLRRKWRIVPRLLQIIWQFPSNAGAEIHLEAAQSPERYRIVRNPRALETIVVVITTILPAMWGELKSQIEP